MRIVKNKVIDLGTIGCDKCKGGMYGSPPIVKVSATHQVFYVEGRLVFRCPRETEEIEIDRISSDHIRKIWQLSGP